MERSLEQRYAVKFCVRLGKNATETFQMLQKPFKDDCISRSQSGKWHKAFKEGREEVADEPRSGRPTTARTDENVDRVLEVLHTDRRLSIQQIADTLHMSTFVVHVTEDLQMRKVCAKLVPKVLTQDQKELRVLRCQELLDLIQNEPDFLNSVVTGDESWMFEYDPESKRQSCAWHTKSSPRPKKARMSKSRIKTMIIVFFDIRGIVHCEFVPQGQTVNSAFYLEVLRRLKRRIPRVRTDIKDTVKLHHDNATSHTAFIITNFLARRNTSVIPHPPYSPDLAPCDFFLFPRLKREMKGKHWETVENIQHHVTTFLRSIPVEEFQGPVSGDDFTVVQNKRKRRNTGAPGVTAAQSNGAGSATGRRRSSPTWVRQVQEIRTTRAHIVEARARQASCNEEQCLYLEYCPDYQTYQYLKAIERVVGGSKNVVQFAKVNGHYLLGLTSRSLAERLIREGLEVEGTLIRTFPFRKSSIKITIGNLPFFVEDAAVINALSRFGRITSIAPKLLRAGEFDFTDGRREAFILLHDGVTVDKLPTRFEIKIKGEAWPAYLTYGIKCSRCHGQGHRRANCPLLHGQSTTSRRAPPLSPTKLQPLTAPGLPKRFSAAPAPAPPSPAVEDSGASPAARAVTPYTAPRPSPPAAPTLPMEEASPAPPPVTPAPSLRAPVSHVPAAPTPDVEMSIIEEISTSSTSSTKTSTREGLVTFIERNPGISFAQTDALGLGREEVLDILSSKTKARKRGPLLSPSQGGALAGLIRQLLGQRPGGDSNIYKVLRQVLSELRTAPTAVPSTPPLPAPRPSGPTPPTSHSEELMPAEMTPPPPAPTEMEEDNPMTEKERVLDRLRFLPIKKLDQRTCNKFCVKNEIKCADTFRMLTVAYGEATLDPSNVYRWYKMLSEGREEVNNEERAGRPSTSTTDEKINEVEKLILANRRITVREVAEDLNISIGSCHSIFINDLGMRRVAAKFVPKLLNCDQKQHRMNIANEMLDSVRDDPNLLQRVITGDE
ncbi:hypothetical protein LAZ67_3001306, partial [Cordylochernes scorpioides]